MSSAKRRKFSTSTTRSVIATAQSSPIVNGCTRWYARTNRHSICGVETAVRMGHECPHQAANARVSLERSVDQFGQLAMEARWKINPDCPNLLLAARQFSIGGTLGGGRDRAGLTDRGDGGVKCGAQCPIIVSKTHLQSPIGRWLRGGMLSRRKALGMLLEPLDAEELRSDRLVVCSRGNRRPGSEQPTG